MKNKFQDIATQGGAKTKEVLRHYNMDGKQVAARFLRMNLKPNMDEQTKADFVELSKLVQMTTPMDPIVFKHLGVLKEITQRHTVDSGF